jgi:Mycobacterium membrane protein
MGAEGPTGVCENGHPAGADDKFCRACGAAIKSPVVCENGHTVPEGKKFCPECGAAVAAAPERLLAGPRLKAWFLGLSRAGRVGLLGGSIVVVVAVVIALTSSGGSSGSSSASDTVPQIPKASAYDIKYVVEGGLPARVDFTDATGARQNVEFDGTNSNVVYEGTFTTSVLGLSASSVNIGVFSDDGSSVTCRVIVNNTVVDEETDRNGQGRTSCNWAPA